MKIALLAGTQSGCGKTTIMLALLQHFCRSKRTVAAFKSGPDFLDPLWHQAITGRPSYNLDTEMIGTALSRHILSEQAEDADWALIEGAMGLFDGRHGVGESGSAADLAKVLHTPVILVVDAKGISGSIVPLVSGFCSYAANMDVTIAGVIANRVGSEHHAELLRNFLADHDLPPLVAWMMKDAPVLKERHLGLMRPDEGGIADFDDFFHVDDVALTDAFDDYPRQREAISVSRSRRLAGKTVAIARDAACCFIYPANVDWLLAQGAGLRYFSLLAGDPVPPAADALWLPGGYPELYGEQLAHSASWPSLRQFIEDHKPVLAECGGAMLLGEKLIDQDGISWSMANLLPYASRMQDRLAALGYREDSRGVKGHEFHHSARVTTTDLPPAFNCRRGDCGVRYKNLRASYIHWYFASASDIVAGWFS
ncbi:cobyrinate a,c-diamide synthase [Methylomarinum sp. Ch1-1]|uniref:Cobyrinate a,c-diamide synthase n=1 Tax=Methylomarinum roseum TaxID=3067653 RepID=A0AAU7NTQ6_9GAMM|nr:cobyrinate a,c-diamide synthase [Methylomarinum sp. Ch1-1]MDP4519561.1 cobyrinate a,c-diamide synthase [Methylomarinum sp. Ch1-1]